MEKQVRVFISHTWRADHKCDSDRRVVWTFTQRTVNVEEHTSFFKWTNKNDRGEVGKFAEWIWFRQTSKLEEQRTEAHLVGKLNRARELGQCQSSIESYSGIECEYRHRHVRRQTGARIKRWMNTDVQHVTQEVTGIQKHIAEHEVLCGVSLSVIVI